MRLTLKQLRTAIIILSFMLLSGGVGWWLGHRDVKIKLEKRPQVEIIDRTQPPSHSEADMSLFWEVWDKLEAKYLMKEKLGAQKMVYGAISGMTAALEDPYTAFFPPKENKAAKENLNGAFEGVGIQLGYKQGNKLAVISPLEGMPAKAAGVKAGDLILRIEDENKGIDEETVGMSLPEAVEIIRGPKGTKVKLTLLHEDEEKPYVAEIVRETIVVPSVEVIFGKVEGDKWVEAETGDIAWLRLIRFGEMTDEQWDQVVEEIKKKRGAVGVVLDLRNNPGGYLDGSINLAGEFLPRGTLVVKQEQSIGKTSQEYSVVRIGRLTEIPLVVLINQGSASASEIMAGALRDHDRAKLVGEKTFGKGTIQEAEDLRGGAGIHITVARWLTPKGTWVHEKGLEPDIEVKNDPEKPEEDRQLVEAIKALLQQ